MSEQEITTTLETTSAAGYAITAASRIRQMIATLAVCGGGVYAAVKGALNWQLVVLLLGGLLAYTAKSVLQQIAGAVLAYFQARVK